MKEEDEGGEKGAPWIYVSSNIALNRSLLWKFP